MVKTVCFVDQANWRLPREASRQVYASSVKRSRVHGDPSQARSLVNWNYLQTKPCVRGRSQLSTFMKAYTAYARGEGVWDHRTLFPWKSTFICNHWQCIIKYCTCLECGKCAHICRYFMYNNTFEALFLMSKCTKRSFLWTQTVAPHRGFCKAAQRCYRNFSTWADSSSQNRTKLRIFH